MKRLLGVSWVALALVAASCAGGTGNQGGSAASPEGPSEACPAQGFGYGYGTSGSKTFCSAEWNVSFQYPADWREVPDYGSPKLEGPTGYVVVGAVRVEQSGTFEETCDSIAHHQLQPFGSDPTVQMRSVAGQPACLILPSEDQAEGNDRMAEVVVHYPKPFTYKDRYQYVSLVADRGHIDQLVSSLAFLSA